MRHQPGRGPRTPYLFLLARPSPGVRREAARALREMGLAVVAQYGRVAVEALATPDEALAAQDLGMFSAVFKGSVKRQHLERLTDEQRRVVEQWNIRFSAGYRRLKEDPSLEGRSWAHPDMDPPGPHAAIEPRDFTAFLEDYERRTGQRAEASPGDEPPSGRTGPRGRGRARGRRPQRPMTPDEFVDYEQDLARRF
jgi:hypothetical protein